MHLEFLEVGAAFLPGRSHDIQEVWREHEGNPLLTDSHETLVIAQDVAKVDVEEISCRNTKGDSVTTLETQWGDALFLYRNTYKIRNYYTKILITYLLIAVVDQR